MHAETDEAGYNSSVSYRTAGSYSPASPPSGKGGGEAFAATVEKGKGGAGGKLSGMFSSSEPHLHVMLVHKEGATTTASSSSSTNKSKSSSPSKPAAASSPSRASSESGAAASAASAAVAGGSSGYRHDPSEVVKPGKGKGAGPAVGVPEADKLLGEAFVNIVDLATARAKSLDEWFPLSEVGPRRVCVC
jgi:hypothetical protein